MHELGGGGAQIEARPILARGGLTGVDRRRRRGGRRPAVGASRQGRDGHGRRKQTRGRRKQTRGGPVGRRIAVDEHDG
jgi:hypothetical protein